MTRPRHGWLLEQLPTALIEPGKPVDPTLRYVEMRRFMRIFEDVANSVEDEIDAMDWYFDPDVAPLRFVRWMGRWLGIDISPTMTADQQTRLLRAAGEALSWRSTARGLQHLLEAFTGSSVEIEDSGGVYVPGDELPDRKRVTVRLDTGGDLEMEQLFALIRDEIPADAALTLEVADEATVEPTPEEHAEQEDEETENDSEEQGGSEEVAE